MDYHGTQIIPAGTFEKGRCEDVFTNILERTEIISFEPQQFIVETWLLCWAKSIKSKTLRKKLKQQWVQIYTIENNLIKNGRVCNFRRSKTTHYLINKNKSLAVLNRCLSLLLPEIKVKNQEKRIKTEQPAIMRYRNRNV